MIVDIANMPFDGKHYAGEEPASALRMGEEPGICVEKPVGYDLKAYMASGELIVEGKLAASVSFRCSRCAESFPFQVEIRDFQCAREVGSDVESVDLTDEIRESIILGFPNHPVCNADCSGLCPECGRNLNQGQCGCQKTPEDARWGVLDGLAGGGEQDGCTQKKEVKE
ncbi:DUF177 domain-containing protein [Verrucomicrobiota bacterium]